MEKNTIEITLDGVRMLNEELPYQSWIKVITERDRTCHTLVFNRDGTERAIAFKMNPNTFSKLKRTCLSVNPSCYFQSYQAGQALSIGVVFFTAWNVLTIIASIVCFFRGLKTLGWVFIGCALLGMLANIFIKYFYSRMKKNDGNDPKRLERASRANAEWRGAACPTPSESVPVRDHQPERE